MYDIQSRWKLQGNTLRYYGLRSAPNMFDNTVRLRKKQQAIVRTLPRGALRYKLRLPMRLYLKKKPNNETEIYI